MTSRLGLGTLFTVRIPVVELPVSGADGAPGAGEAGAGLSRVPPGIRVLVVEDQPVNRLLLRKVLAKARCVLEEAENGRVAVEKWSAFRPEIILMDENMPEMKGTEAARRILAEAGTDPPVIISLTAFAMEEQREAALAAGCAGFLAKPFKQDDLFGLLAKYGRGDGPADAEPLRRAA